MSGLRARGVSRRAPGGRSRTAVATLLLSLPLVTGCYAHRQVSFASVHPGDLLLVGITDQGRVGLVESLGPGAERVRGIVEQRSDSALVMQVEHVQYLGGRGERWAGERVQVARSHVAVVTERRFARGRTWATVSGVAAAVAAFAIAIDLGGGGSRGTGGTAPPPIGTQ